MDECVGGLFGEDAELEEHVFHFGGHAQRILALPSSVDHYSVQGHLLWQGSKTLAAFLCTARGAAFVALCAGPGGRAVELGAGCGLAGIVLSQQGAQSVLMTDYDPDVVETLRGNAVVNAPPAPRALGAAALDWCRPPRELAGAFGVAIAADVCHAPDLYPALFSAAASLVAPGGVFLMGNGKWRYRAAECHAAAQAAGLRFEWDEDVPEDGATLSLYSRPCL
eukprot:m51a1_g5486 hypothetical protein (223) ;mRNA; f:320544-321298